MKIKFTSLLLALFFASIFTSCSQEDEVLLSNSQTPQIGPTFENISFGEDSITPLLINPDSTKTQLFEKLYGQKLRGESTKLTAMTRSSYASPNDDYFWTNMFAIRELPVTLQARSGANTNNRFLSTNGKNKEVTLVASATSKRQKFYFRILPATAGIPCLIYSQAEGTPITVGQYKNKPDNKVLFVAPDDKGSLYSLGWDLIPSAHGYNGYYAIQSESYSGLSDPNNMWSMFYHVIEVIKDNKIGYAKYSKKGQQEFLIKPDAVFDLCEIEFDQQSAVITERAKPHVIPTKEKNTSWNPAKVEIHVNEKLSERSSFQQKKTIAFDFLNPNHLFARPTVVAGRLIFPTSSTTKDALYAANTTKEISNFYNFKDVVDAPERCLIEHSTFVKTYDIKVNYTAKARYTVAKDDVREAVFSGTWTGVIYPSPEVLKPLTTQRFFNLETNEEIVVLSRSAHK